MRGNVPGKNIGNTFFVSEILSQSLSIFHGFFDKKDITREFSA